MYACVTGIFMHVCRYCTVYVRWYSSSNDKKIQNIINSDAFFLSFFLFFCVGMCVCRYLFFIVTFRCIYLFDKKYPSILYDEKKKRHLSWIPAATITLDYVFASQAFERNATGIQIILFLSVFLTHSLSLSKLAQNETLQ